jgi:hypothetical protein
VGRVDYAEGCLFLLTCGDLLGSVHCLHKGPALYRRKRAEREGRFHGVMSEMVKSRPTRSMSPGPTACGCQISLFALQSRASALAFRLRASPLRSAPCLTMT